MTRQDNKLLHWGLFILISIIWGSSFILMKKGMYAANGQPTLSAFHVAALRVLSGGLVLLPIAIRKFRLIPASKRWLVVLSGLLGAFIPAFLFCLAETKIDSSLAGFLNALTPVFTIVIGVAFFQSKIIKRKIFGVAIAFSGMLLLFLANDDLNLQYLSYAGLILVATISYACNVNLVGKYLKDIGSVNIAAISFGALAIPSLIILLITGYFDLPLTQSDYVYSTLSSVVLGVFGTAVASILFYVLLKKAGTIFASMVTYGIPFIALGWGILDGETINALQVVGLTIILGGVYLANK
ncbi:MAG: DMT family transporter [Chitinophagaceae bacterium]|nr:DMT family transporter [Chitinophagaceae bacterium]